MMMAINETATGTTQIKASTIIRDSNAMEPLIVRVATMKSLLVPYSSA
jgi:hypothetical protein